MSFRTVKSVVSSMLLFGGYSVLLLQWLWVLIIGIPPLIERGVFDSMNIETSTSAPVIQSPSFESSPLLLWIVGSVTVAILIVTIAVLMRLPKTVVTSSEHIVERAARAVIPVITRHKTLPTKRRLTLTRNVKAAIQAIASIIAGLICLFLPAVEGLSRELIVVVGLGLMAVSLANFGLAWLIGPNDTTSRTRLPASRG